MDSPLQNCRAVAAADVVRNFGCESFVVHEKEVEFPHVVDKEFFQAIGEQMSRLLVASVANLRYVFSKSQYTHHRQRTLGIGVWPLKRLRTLLSIPLGFLHASLTPW